MRNIYGALILVTLSMTLACSTTGKNGELAGTATDGSSPLAGVVVTVSSPALDVPRVTATDESGEFHVFDLPSGTYAVSFEHAGFHPSGHTVQIAASGQRLDVSLTPLAARPPSVVDATDAATRSAQYEMAARLKGVVGGVVGGPRRDLATTGSFQIAQAPASMIAPGSFELDPNSEEYAQIAEGRFLSAREKPLSTFSIDVDRASYSNIRRFLSEGRLPPADAVRIEEMINYFNYSYPPPADGKPFAVHAEVASCPWNEENRLLRIGIQGRKIDEWRMPPNNLVFLLDVSGSMQSADKLPLVKDAFRLLVDRLRPQDQVSIVVYAGAAGTVLPPTSGADKPAILDAIAKLEAGGSTAGGEGILLAYETARRSFIRDGNNRVILATDGDFNVGVSSEAELEDLIVTKRREGVYLSVLGFGTGNLKDAKMELLADKGNGNYAYIDSKLEAEKVFVQELGGTLLTIASDVKIQMEFNPAVVSEYRLVGYENRALRDRDFDDDTKDAGELGAGHSVTALYEVRPAAGASADRSAAVATLRLRYKDPGAEKSNLISSAVHDQRKSWYQASEDFRFAAAVAQFGMLLRSSENRGTANWTTALDMAKRARGTDLEGYRGEMISMLEAAAAISDRPKIVRAQ